MFEELFPRAEGEAAALKRLSDIMRVLRSPEGCPWDRAQTHDSLRRGMIEEAYEVVEAIENKDTENLREELGDVLLQIFIHSQIAEDLGTFDLADVANDECDKMIRRHPHVFAKKPENIENKGELGIDNVLDMWENIKVAEKKSSSATESMNKIPRELPALLRAEKIQAKAAKVGFDWDDVGPAFDKIAEETAELKEARAEEDRAHMKEELGDLLFAVVNVARFLDIDPEDALNETSRKFMKRFSYIESEALSQGRRPEDMSLEEMDKLWNDAKKLTD